MNANTTVVPTPHGLVASAIEGGDYLTVQGHRTIVHSSDTFDGVTTLVITVPSNTRLTVSRS